MLKINALSKHYCMFATPRARLRHLLWGGEAGVLRHLALHDISFELAAGECLGIVGDNGAGKSTLLKLIAGTISPSSGSVSRSGRLTAILELGAGFHPEFTGRENIHFAGALIGIEAEEMRRRESEIIAFSEIGDAVDRPIKTYSSGMIVRLAFALVTAVDPEILVVDEALAVGDQHFQRKCIERIDRFRERGCTILFCSHSLYHVRRLCNRAIWIAEGRMRAFGDTEEVLTAYEANVRRQNTASQGNSSDRFSQESMPVVEPHDLALGAEPAGAVQVRAVHARIVDVEVGGVSGGGLDAEILPRLVDADLIVTVHAQTIAEEQPHIAVMLERSDGVGVCAVGTHADRTAPVLQADGLWRASVRFPEIPLYSGEYAISAYLFDSAGVNVYDEWSRCERFVHVYPTLETGIVRLRHEWS